jgi:hypothetical protein
MFHLAEVFSCMPHPIAGLPGPLQLQLVNEMVAVMRHIERRSLLKPQPFLSQGGNITVQVGRSPRRRLRGNTRCSGSTFAPAVPAVVTEGAGWAASSLRCGGGRSTRRGVTAPFDVTSNHSTRSEDTRRTPSADTW